MTVNEIKSLLILKGIKQSDIAASLNVRRSTVSGAISRKRLSRRIQKAIATALDEDYEKIWGETK